MRKNILDAMIAEKIEAGYSLYEKTQGTVTARPGSNVQKVKDAARREGYTDIIVVVGGRAGRYQSQGYKMAVMVK